MCGKTGRGQSRGTVKAVPLGAPSMRGGKGGVHASGLSFTCQPSAAPTPATPQTVGPADPSLWELNTPGRTGPAKHQGDTAGKSKHRAALFPSSAGARRKSPLGAPARAFMGPGPRSLGTGSAPTGAGFRLDGAGARPRPIPTGRWTARAYF